ncbi:MAG: hypothetical protein JSV17_00370 [Candidatus Aminicenantes bacterium]|nr:MAG: hypothetical protein JSV17_00370 [Candidatus Aminicenantes bacterium]
MNETETKSSNTTKKWLVGCGIGCAVIILILIVLGVGGYVFFKNLIGDFQEQEELMAVLTERYGEIKDFSPEPDGAIDPSRIEAFLSVRDAFAPFREKLEISMQELQDRAGQSEVEVKKPKNVFEMVKLGFGLVPQIAEFLKFRNQALLDAEMGMGEYFYIYAISYFSWLGKPPEDGPDFEVMGPEDRESRWGEMNRKEIREERRDSMLRRLHRTLLPMLQNQHEKLVARGLSDAQSEWKDLLEAEIQAMEEDRFRLPWEDGLPDVIKRSLEPYRERLEQSYNAMTNPFELTTEQR